MKEVGPLATAKADMSVPQKRGTYETLVTQEMRDIKERQRICDGGAMQVSDDYYISEIAVQHPIGETDKEAGVNTLAPIR